MDGYHTSPEYFILRPKKKNVVDKFTVILYLKRCILLKWNFFSHSSVSPLFGNINETKKWNIIEGWYTVWKGERGRAAVSICVHRHCSSESVVEQDKRISPLLSACLFVRDVRLTVKWGPHVSYSYFVHSYYYNVTIYCVVYIHRIWRVKFCCSEAWTKTTSFPSWCVFICEVRLTVKWG